MNYNVFFDVQHRAGMEAELRRLAINHRDIPPCLQRLLQRTLLSHSTALSTLEKKPFIQNLQTLPTTQLGTLTIQDTPLVIQETALPLPDLRLL